MNARQGAVISVPERDPDPAICGQGRQVLPSVAAARRIVERPVIGQNS